MSPLNLSRGDIKNRYIELDLGHQILWLHGPLHQTALVLPIFVLIKRRLGGLRSLDLAIQDVPRVPVIKKILVPH